MTIIPIIPFEEMSPEDQRAHLEELLAEDGFDSEQINKFFKTKRRPRRNERMNTGQYVTARWAAEQIGKGEDSLREEFMKETSGVIKRTFSGRNRKTVHTLLIAKSCLKKHYPDVNI
jgi:hypothetical protein